MVSVLRTTATTAMLLGIWGRFQLSKNVLNRYIRHLKSCQASIPLLAGDSGGLVQLMKWLVIINGFQRRRIYIVTRIRSPRKDSTAYRVCYFSRILTKISEVLKWFQTHILMKCKNSLVRISGTVGVISRLFRKNYWNRKYSKIKIGLSKEKPVTSSFGTHGLFMVV